LPTAANDAGLIAQTLQAAGFDVVGARDLDQDSLRRALREFADKAASSGPDTVAFIYLSGDGLQLEGENYFLPVDADIHHTGDVAVEALRLSDYLRRLASLKLKASFVVLDAARAHPFEMSGEVLAGGFALVEPASGMLVAFNAAPGTIAPERDGPYGAYAQALAEMMREGGLSPAEVFERVRLRVNDATKGAQVPWSTSRIDAPFIFFERSTEAPAPTASIDDAIGGRRLRDLPAPQAYFAAVARDTLESFEEFLAAYPDDPMVRRVRALLAARRESIIWRLTVVADTKEAYWSYLRRYPHGPHAADAQRRLALRAFASEPPAAFAPVDYEVPPPPADELPYVERPALEFTDADLPPPPALPIYFLPPAPVEFVELPPPLPAVEVFALPFPIFVPLPVWCHRPAYVAPPPQNVIYENIHNRVVVNHVSGEATIADRNGHVVSAGPHSSHRPMALGTPLPSSILGRAAVLHRAPQSDARSQVPSGLWRQQPANPPRGRPLPGADGRSLPPLRERSAPPHLGSLAPVPSGPAARESGSRPLPQATAPRGFQALPTPTSPRQPQWRWEPRAHSAPSATAPSPQATPQRPAFVPPAYRPALPQAPAASVAPQVRSAPMRSNPTYRAPPQAPAHSAFGLAVPSRPPVAPIARPSIPRIAPAPAAPPPAVRIAPPPVAHVAPAPAFRPPAPPVPARVAPAPVYRPPAPAAPARPAQPGRR
jgi:uncharacterized caspase-like protein